MREFILLIGQLGFIAMLQVVLAMLIDTGKNPEHGWLLKTACVMGAVYLLLEYASDYLIPVAAAFLTF